MSPGQYNPDGLPDEESNHATTTTTTTNTTTTTDTTDSLTDTIPTTTTTTVNNNNNNHNHNHTTQDSDITYSPPPPQPSLPSELTTTTTTTTTTNNTGMDVENGGATVNHLGSQSLRMIQEEPDHRQEVIQRAISQTWVAPDGGYGWVVMLSSLMISVIVDGVTYTFGVFLQDLEEAFQEPKSTITLANSLQVGLYLCSGPLVSVLTNRFGCRPIIIVGSVLAGVSFILSALSPNISLLIFTYGILGGLGFGMMYLPSVVAVSIYFEKKRALATGIAVCGSGIGTLALAPLTEVMLMEYNWRWTLILLSAIVFHGVICGGLIRPLELRVIDKSKRNDSNVFNNDEDQILLQQAVASCEDELAQTQTSPPPHHHRQQKRNFLSPDSAHQNYSASTAAQESIPLITLTDDTNKTRLVPGDVIDPRSNNASSSAATANSEKNIKFFSSTPNMSSDITRRKKSDSSSSSAFGQFDNGVIKQRNRANTLDNINKLSPMLPRQDSRNASTGNAATPRVMARAPIGLSFISVSDVHMNKIRDDVALPLSRRDINKSMLQMEFGEMAGAGGDAVMLSEESLASRMSSMGNLPRRRKGLWGCLPESARDTLEDMLNLGIFNDKRYWFVIAGNFLCMFGFYVPFVYIPSKAGEIGVSDTNAAYLISVIGITNVIGRVATGMLVNKFKFDSVLVTSTALSLAGLLTFVCPFVDTFAVLMLIAALFGLCVAAYISLCSILLCELLGVVNLTNAFGYVILFRGVACCMGPPIAGALIDASGKSDPAFFVGGAMIVLGGLSHFFLLTPCLRHPKKTS